MHSMSLTAGYHDVPEGSSPCRPAAPGISRCHRARIDRLDIPIDRTGHTKIVLGELLSRMAC
jgi:hypothetical protein